jgi:glycosyltransferase involved in cell wall biosynthesis
MDALTPTHLVDYDDPGSDKDLSIAAIMPLYNGAKWVEQSIRSILTQTRMPDEVIVVDDGSTDDGPAIVRQLSAEYPIIKLLHKPNGGQSSARNFAVAHSKCALISLLDQDDVWYPSHLELLVKPFEEHKGGLPIGWTYSSFDDIDENGGLISRPFMVDGLENPKRQLNSILYQGMIIQPSATLISRAAFVDVGGFDERLCGYEDDDLFLRIFRANFDNFYIPESTSQWRIHSSSCGSSDRHDNSLRLYVQKLLEMFPNDTWRGVYYARDLIAPRFIATWIAMYARAARYKNHAKMREYARDAFALVRYLSVPRMLVFGPALIAMRSPVAGRAILAINSRRARNRRRSRGRWMAVKVSSVAS